MANEYQKSLSRDRQLAAMGRVLGSIESVWNAVPNTEPGTADASLIAVSTVVDATSSRRHIDISYGTSLLLRLAYPKDCATITDPTVRILGVDKEGNYGWVFSGAETITSAVTSAASTDLSDGVTKTTNVSKYTIFDMQGYSQALVFVASSMAAATGATEVANAEFEYKVV